MVPHAVIHRLFPNESFVLNTANTTEFEV